MSNNNFSFIDHSDSIGDTTRFWFIRHAIVNEKDRSYLYGTKDVPICPTHLKKQQTYYQFLAKKLPKTQLWLQEIRPYKFKRRVMDLRIYKSKMLFWNRILEPGRVYHMLQLKNTENFLRILFGPSQPKKLHPKVKT